MSDFLRVVQMPLLCVLSDVNPQVGFYWRRGERIVPRGHRRGNLEPIRFQIDDRPLCQIRITQQLPQVRPHLIARSLRNTVFG